MVTLRPTSTSSVSAVTKPAATGSGFLRVDSGTSLITPEGDRLAMVASSMASSMMGRAGLGHLAMLLGQHGIGHQARQRHAQLVGQARDHAGLTVFHGFEAGARHVGGRRLVFL